MSYSRLLKLTSPMMHGNDVTQVQTRLKALNYMPGTIDGWYGSKTKAAVIRFQQRNKLTQDGIVGPNTWNKLFSPSAVREVTISNVGKSYYRDKAADIFPINYPSYMSANTNYSIDIGVVHLTYKYSYNQDFSVFLDDSKIQKSFTISNGVPDSFTLSTKCTSFSIPLSTDVKNMFNNLCIGIGNGTVFLGLKRDGSLSMTISQDSPAGYIYHEITIKGNDNYTNLKEFLKITACASIVVCMAAALTPATAALGLSIGGAELINHLAN